MSKNSKLVARLMLARVVDPRIAIALQDPPPTLSISFHYIAPINEQCVYRTTYQRPQQNGKFCFLLYARSTTLPGHHCLAGYVRSTTLPSHHSLVGYVRSTTLPSHHGLVVYVMSTTLPSHHCLVVYVRSTILHSHHCLVEYVWLTTLSSHHLSGSVCKVNYTT